MMRRGPGNRNSIFPRSPRSPSSTNGATAPARRAPPGRGPTKPRVPVERRAKKERRRRIDPTTFEKQYTDDELEFMNAMQRFKVQAGKSFPTHGEVLKVAFSLGYRKVISSDENDLSDAENDLEEGGSP